jgi:hypothetical protein
MSKHIVSFRVKVITNYYDLPLYCVAFTPDGRDYPLAPTYVQLAKAIGDIRALQAKTGDTGNSCFVQMVKMLKHENQLGLYEAKQIADLLCARKSSRIDSDDADVVQERTYTTVKLSQEEFDKMMEVSRATR